MSSMSKELFSTEKSYAGCVQTDASAKSVLSVRDLRKQVELGNHRELDILKGIDFEIKHGESVAIVGRSGSGKTTLLGILAGLDTASSGSVSLMGKTLEALDEDERAALRARYVGFVFQSFHLLPSLTALENVMMPLEMAQHDEPMKHAATLLSSLGLGDRLEHYPAQMSGGEQQRVALARAFAADPEILFADEPTGNLDRTTGEEIINALFERNRLHQTTLVIVTHDPELAKRCDRQLLIEDGLIVTTERLNSTQSQEEQAQ